MSYLPASIEYLAEPHDIVMLYRGRFHRGTALKELFTRRAMTRILHGIVKDCTDMGVRRIALGWYTPESWQQLKAVATDELEDSFEEFVHKMTKQIQQWEVNGFEVVKVYIDIDHLVAWCKRHGYRVDSRSRAAYGTLLAMHDGELFDINTPIEGLPGRMQ